VRTRAKKSWGQHFLCDAGVLSRTVAALLPAGRVIELGAGYGALTAPLLAAGFDVVAVEHERDALAGLRGRFGNAVAVVDQDAARLDYCALRGGGPPLVVAGNLPYQIAGRILGELAGHIAHVERGVFMVQWEVAERICAQPGSRRRGLLSVLVQRAFHAQILERVPPTAFAPPPKVESALLRLDHAAAPAAPEVAELARAAFMHRRKVLRNTIPGGAARLQRAGIDECLRAEDLSIDDFARLLDA
jgi:16S rRNA (adenine1518-N6/adenine1519-N6)-dimethyltransferase